MPPIAAATRRAAARGCVPPPGTATTATSSKHAKADSAAAAAAASREHSSDDLERRSLDQEGHTDDDGCSDDDGADQQQHQRHHQQQHHSHACDSSSEEDAASEDEEAEEEQPRARSHDAAAAGPSSRAAAAAAPSKRGGKKRTAAQAALAQDPVALLPPDLDEAQLVRIRQALPQRNRMQKQGLLLAYRTQFPHWRLLLRQRFSLLFYGFGSKRALLEEFARAALTDGGVLAINGLHHGMTSKQVLQAAASALTHRSCKSLSHGELLALIEGEPGCRQLYLLLHNIDGPGLRAAEDQLWLSRLSQAPAVRLLASVDHVNAALLWNSRVAAAFNWVWLEATSYAAYEGETRHAAPIVTSCKQSAAKRGATTVLATLVSSAREVFKLLASEQLEATAGGGGSSGAGVSFPSLLRLVRDRFVLNSEQALKSVLAELRDHELIKLRPGADGGEVIVIPMEPAMLRRAVQDLQAAEEGA